MLNELLNSHILDALIYTLLMQTYSIAKHLHIQAIQLHTSEHTFISLIHICTAETRNCIAKIAFFIAEKRIFISNDNLFAANYAFDILSKFVGQNY